MRTAIVIPARYASSRLPAKPLLRATGKYLVQHVYERACQSAATAVIVATDDERIREAVRSFGGRVIMTRADHVSGTDRVAEVAEQLDAEVIVNLQGDEPLVEPATLDLLPGLLARDPESEVATLAVPITSIEQWQDPNCVKVVRDTSGRALYFSRSPIPFVRDGRPDFPAPDCSCSTWGCTRTGDRSCWSWRSCRRRRWRSARNWSSCACWRSAGVCRSASSPTPAAESIRRPTMSVSWRCIDRNEQRTGGLSESTS